jgi:hypothetical protein
MIGSSKVSTFQQYWPKTLCFLAESKEMVSSWYHDEKTFSQFREYLDNVKLLRPLVIAIEKEEQKKEIKEDSFNEEVEKEIKEIEKEGGKEDD